MALEKVLIANNTSVVQDEVLSHRMGLIPLKVDPRLFSYKSEKDEPNDKNTIVFGLNSRCERGGQRLTVKSEQLKWQPSGSMFPLELENKASSSTSKPQTYTNFTSSQDLQPEFSSDPICPKYPDITIARLGPGQEIELEAHAVKGIGKEHAKWSPVATAWYRMLPGCFLRFSIFQLWVSANWQLHRNKHTSNLIASFLHSEGYPLQDIEYSKFMRQCLQYCNL